MNSQPDPINQDSLTVKSPSSFFKIPQRDILAELLADKRSPNTRRAYARDLKEFFLHIADHEPNPQLVGEFLKLERFTAIALVLQFKAALIDKGLAEATVNRRLSAIKSLVSYAQKVGQCLWSLEEVQGEKVKAYRDTTGVGKEEYALILQTCDRATLPGLRDYAILRLLWDNVLRRGEIAKLNITDFDGVSQTLSILGKGRGTQAENVTLSGQTVGAIGCWIVGGRCRVVDGKVEPLFIALDTAHAGHRMSGAAIYEMVRRRAKAAGISKRMSPHRVRHSGITAALDATNGDVRRVQKLSRHVKLETIALYDDSRKNFQGEVTNILADLIDGAA